MKFNGSITISLKLLVTLALILVGITGSYFAVDNQMRHLNDTKADKTTVSEINERLIRIEVKLDLALGNSGNEGMKE